MTAGFCTFADMAFFSLPGRHSPLFSGYFIRLLHVFFFAASLEQVMSTIEKLLKRFVRKSVPLKKALEGRRQAEESLRLSEERLRK